MNKETPRIISSSNPTIENLKSKIENRNRWTRREFLAKISFAGAGALFGSTADSFAAAPPPETTRIRIPQIPSACRSPEWIAEELLRTEGFTDVQYNRVQGTRGVERALANGEADIVRVLHDARRWEDLL